MPSSAEHRDKADRNRKLLDTLKTSGVPEWIAVVAFYTALHLVERLSACESIHNANHQDRLAYLNRHKKHRVIHASFQTLYDASQIARYGTVNQFDRAFPADTVEKTLVRKYLAAIEMYVLAHFAQPAAAPPVSP